MSDSAAPQGQKSEPPANEPRLESWGEIAAYLRRDIRTVQRWERHSGLPVRRLQVGKLATVYAYRSELDKWFLERQPKAENDEPPLDASPPVSGNGEEPVEKKVPGSRDLKRGLLAALILVAAGSGIYFLIAKRSHSSGPALEKTRLFVRPFANHSGDSNQDAFTQGLTDEINTQLGKIAPQHLGVIAPTSSNILAAKSIDELRRDLHVQYVLEGSVRRGLNQVRIDVQLISASDQTPVWTDAFTNDLSDILRTQDEVAAAVAKRILVTFPEAEFEAAKAASQVSPKQVNPEAFDAYLRGRFYWTNRGDLHKSIEAYQQAIEKDPNYALAYAGLASAYALLGQVPYDDMSPFEAKPKAREAAEHALRLDPKLGEAHSVLANVSFSYDWDFEAAEREFQSAFALGPSDPTGHLWFGHYCVLRNRLPQALAENSRTLDLDPVSPLFNTVRAEIYYNSRQYDAAIAQAQRTIDQYPTYWLAYIWLGSAYREKKMYTEALQAFSEARKLSGDHPVMIALSGHALALSGDAAGARKTLADLQRLARSRYISSLYIAAVYTGLGEKRAALDSLDRAYKEHNDRLVYLGVDPIADPLRSDPRFRALMNRLHLL